MKISNILGFSQKSEKISAHEVHLGTIAYFDGYARHVIYKKNKYPGKAGEDASKLEASFTSVANAFSAPQRALKQEVVTDSKG